MFGRDQKPLQYSTPYCAILRVHDQSPTGAEIAEGYQAQRGGEDRDDERRRPLRAQDKSVDAAACVTTAHVVIAHRQPLVMEGLAHVVRGCVSGSIERCKSERELMAALLGERVDLAIVDGDLEEHDRLRVVRGARNRHVTIPLIVMTSHGRDSNVLRLYLWV